MKSSHEGRVGVVGGGIAGCAAAIAAARAGNSVTVYERTPADLTERGFGLTLSPEVYDELTTARYLPREAPALPLTGRVWVTREPGGSGWRELWRQDGNTLTCNWGQLWRWLRSAVPSGAYRAPHRVDAVHTGDEDEAVVHLADHARAHHDLVVGADGHRSVARDAVPGSPVPRYAGYVAVRGVLGLDHLGDDQPTTQLLATSALTALFDDGHVNVHLIPDETGLLVSWALYTRPPHEIDIDPRGIPGPDATTARLAEWVRAAAAELLPPQIARIIERTPDDTTDTEPVVDRPAEYSGHRRLVLVGNANALARPHTGSGAVRALQDALTLERALRSNPSIADAVAAFDAQRRPAANQLVELGRRIGRDQVERTPDWLTMTGETLGAHVAATWAGRHQDLHDSGLDRSAARVTSSATTYTGATARYGRSA